MTLEDQIIETFTSLDSLSADYSKKRADYNYANSYLKVVLSLEKEKYDGSDAERTRRALTSDTYTTYLLKVFKSDKDYYLIEGQRNALERKLDSLRSLLSYEKNQINRTT